MNTRDDDNKYVDSKCDCECRGCGGVKKPSKKKFLFLALVTGGIVGAVFGLKYKTELIKATNDNLKNAKKNKYIKNLNNGDLDKLVKDFHKKAKKASKNFKKNH